MKKVNEIFAELAKKEQDDLFITALYREICGD